MGSFTALLYTLCNLVPEAVTLHPTVTLVMLEILHFSRVCVSPTSDCEGIMKVCAVHKAGHRGCGRPARGEIESDSSANGLPRLTNEPDRISLCF
jgi:hypothetical protein